MTAEWVATVWRRSDLHRHTSGDGVWKPISASEFVSACLRDGLDLVALADHDRIDQVKTVREAAAGALAVISGIEVTTDRGHTIALAPGDEGLSALVDLISRVGIQPGTEIKFDDLVDVVTHAQRPSGVAYRDAIVLVGAHVERSGSLLGPGQTLSPQRQVEEAERLQALEVTNTTTLKEWAKGVIKEQRANLAIIQGSDAHAIEPYELRPIWIYLPELTTEWLRHAFATPEASIVIGPVHPTPPNFWIKAIRFEGGLFAGRRFEFSQRLTALIGPPSSGKSFLLDALRFAFDADSTVAEVRTQANERLAHCLPDGASVIVEVVEDGVTREIRRVRGGAAPATEARRPLMFGQTELTRRAMESTPAMELLDVHCAMASMHKQNLQRLTDELVKVIADSIALADEARVLRDEVDNPQDGLVAVNAEYAGIVGSEAAAGAAQRFSVVERWRKTLASNARTWLDKFRPPSGPTVPAAPPPDPPLPVNLAELVISNRVSAALEKFQADVTDAATRAEKAIQAALTATDQKVRIAREQIEKDLGRELGAGADVADRVLTLRERLADLQSKSAELGRLDNEIDAKLLVADALIDKAEGERNQLRLARKETCRTVNESMPSFVARLDQDAHVARLDALLDDLKVGTNYRPDTMEEMRNRLERKQLVRTAIRDLQGSKSGEIWSGNETTVADRQARVACEAARKRKHAALARAATMWPGDALGLLHKVDRGDPLRFEKLTEGLRALAIKEISFAASTAPVISDQPEDAVPTANVFDSLVPTIRSQRSMRQFIIASHDANIVVAGDAERVFVLSGHESAAQVGSLFDDAIRGEAMTHLEGGPKAFRVRQRRYGREAAAR